ncbi:hypothetical protein GGQ22_13915 [Nocardioides sp. zg-579]|uniref:PH domain-containing protein n=1 Tax=Nocardioides marmotae TaxID=2663857 RepID=A0A6I3JDD4_9ACTN|nr:hypothetical protein [Nocardioides marmotae]MCR6032525.1 hypothetical protein [Gordonia jinghuaiqii]MTB96174.1 hypothetical protein [Nocardioides marmotae]QKD99751.1 hypothetical protein HPC71_00555 [Nocardioides marmotae]
MSDAAPSAASGAPQPGTTPTEYRLAPTVAVRFVGAALVLLAVLVLVATALVATGLPGDVVVVLAALGVLGVLALGWWLRSGLAVVRFDDAGYRVRLVRGAGVKQAAWSEVQEAQTASPRGIRCIVLRLVDGRTTTIPVDVLAGDPDEVVRELQVRLRRGEGLRPL